MNLCRLFIHTFEPDQGESCHNPPYVRINSYKEFESIQYSDKISTIKYYLQKHKSMVSLQLTERELGSNEELGQIQTPRVPREGEFIDYDGNRYRVQSIVYGEDSVTCVVLSTCKESTN